MTKRLKTNRIIIHCSAEPPGRISGAADIRRWHLAKGWRDVGYHYVIRTNGIVERGRAIDDVGAHTKNENSDSIGICLIGGLDEDWKPSADYYTSAQWEALERVVRELRAEYKPVDIEVLGHNQFAAKACPCFDVPAWWAQVEATTTEEVANCAGCGDTFANNDTPPTGNGLLPLCRECWLDYARSQINPALEK